MKNSVRIKRDNLFLLMMYFSSIFFYAANSTVLAIERSLQRYDTALILLSLDAIGLFSEVFYSQVRPFSISSIQINIPLIHM